MSYQKQFLLAKNESRKISQLSSLEKNNILLFFAKALEENREEIKIENAKDIERAKKSGGGPMIDRLLLNEDRIQSMANDVRNVAGLPEEVGKIVDETIRPNGLTISQIRVPIGVVGMIYESRPNVTVDAAVLALKSGNAIVLKGGKEAMNSNRILVKIMRKSLLDQGYSEESIQLLDTSDRTATAELLSARGLIDVVIPRGGKGLIHFVMENAKIPVIETGASVVHTFVDISANIKEAVEIVGNEKLRRVSVCNALDTLLLHKSIAKPFLSLLLKFFSEKNEKNNFPLVEVHADKTSMSILANVSYAELIPLEECDFETEWLDYKMSVRVVENVDEAIEHIQKYSLGHSESICSKNQENIDRFLKEVDSACVYANASTAFSDGSEFGLGAEIGISTQKLHVRGPFALQGLTSTKWIIRGDGHVR